MKKKLLYCLCCAALFVGCTKDPNEVIVPQGEQIPIQLLGSIDQVAASRVNDEGFCNGDGIGVYVVNYQNGEPGTMLSEGNQADNVRYVYNEQDYKWTPDYPIYYYDKVTPVDIIGYYPYVSNIDNVNAYSFELAKDQSTEAANGLMGGYEASDFLWGKAEKVSPTASLVKITFNHKMAGVQVELIEGTGWGENEWAGLDKQVLVCNTIRKASIDLSTGDVTAVGDIPTTGTVPAKSGDGWRAIVVPQSVVASMALLNITVDGTPYIFRKSEPFEYTSGKLHKFSVKVSKKSGSGLEFKLVGESITAWESETITHDGTAREYVIINVPAASTDGSSALKTAIEASGKDYTKIKNLKVTGEVNAHDFFFMRDEMSVLQRLNMQECTVAEGYSNSYPSTYNAHEIPSRAFYGKSSLVRIIFPEDVVKIGSTSFMGTNLSGVLVLPSALEAIDSSQTFLNLSGITSITFNSKLREIGEYAFSGCSGITGELDFPESLISIGDDAFKYCKGITSLKLPSNLESIGSGAFGSCESLKGSLVIPNKIKYLHDNIFFNCALDGTLTLPDGLLTIENNAFYGCPFQGELHLPKSLLSIGEDAFLRGNFTGDLVLPQNLLTIGACAFKDCSRLTGVVEIPEGVVSISTEAFSGCKQLEGIVLHDEIETIQPKAFLNCYQISTIVSKAAIPPTLAADAFNGVAKDNFTVEVPEASVNDYSLASNWKEFKRIAAYHNFAISRNLLRTLNAGEQKKLLLRADAGVVWSLESKPDWVTVEPISGVGKIEVTITINAMEVGNVCTFKVESYNDSGELIETEYSGRAGEVVFLLEGKDYRTRTKVEQYDYTYGDGDVITNQTATKGNGVDIVFMGDCFDAQDIATGKYLNGINEAIEYFFAVEPYATYKDYFNIYTVLGLSADSGVGSVNTIREGKFGSQYGLQSAGAVGVDESICFEYACMAPTVTADNICQTPIVLVENTSEYDGITYMWGDGSAIALVPMSVDEYPYDFRGVLQHEAGGHAFGKLADEYIYHNAFIQTCGCNCCGHTDEFNKMKSYGFYRNLSLTGNMYDVPWSHLIFDEKYQNTVDIYEGGYMHTRGCFRSEPNSCMNNNIPYFSAISRQAIVERIMEYAGEEFSFEEWKAKDKGLVADEPATRTLSAPENRVPYKSHYQHTPKFMGEKPVLNF